MPKLEDIQRFLEQEESRSDGLIYTDPEAIKARKRMIVWIGRRLGGTNVLEDIPNYLFCSAFTMLIAGAIGFWVGSSWVMFISGGCTLLILQMIWFRRPSWCLRRNGKI